VATLEFDSTRSDGSGQKDWKKAGRASPAPTKIFALRKLLLAGSGRNVGVFLLEALNAAGGVHKFLLARKEGVAARADFDAEHIALNRRTSLECAPASAVDGNGMVVRMNTGFHGSPI
jgi:hypothetical protein